MTNNFSHIGNNTVNFPPILEQAKKTYKIWLPILKNFPKPEQFGIGSKIDRYFLDLLEILRLAAFSPIEEKTLLIGKSLKLIDSIRFFLQLCWELKLISTKQFAHLGNEIETVGQMAGGWKKDCDKKNFPVKGRKEVSRGRQSDCRHSSHWKADWLRDSTWS